MRRKDEWHEYIAVYVDDFIVASEDHMSVIDEFKKIGGSKLKGVGEPEYYLGGDIERVKIKCEAQTMLTKISAKTYIANVCDKIERVFDITLKNYHSPLQGGDYHPEQDESELLDDVDISKYRMLIGSINWPVTLGRFGVMFPVITIARYSSMPMEGHMKVCLRIFGKLKYHSKGTIRFHVNKPILPGGDDPVKIADWSQLYPDAKEDIVLNQPKPVGNSVRTWMMVDADHAHDLETRISVSGVLFFVNGNIKRQATIEISTYGSEIVAMKSAVEIAYEMRYKLKMLGIEIDGPTIIFGDNRTVVLNGSKPKSTLKKKHHLCSIHSICHASVSSVVPLRSIGPAQNISDCLTKALAPHVLQKLVKPILFRKGWKDITSALNDL